MSKDIQYIHILEIPSQMSFEDRGYNTHNTHEYIIQSSDYIIHGARPTVLAPKAHPVNLLYVKRVVSTVIYTKQDNLFR
jgi:hypothetical protein